MKTAIMQPYLFPYIGYFQLINAVNKFIILDDVNYINKGWINRNNMIANKQKTLFTFPLIKASQNKLINEIEISEDKIWATKFLKTLTMSYKKAPFFEETKALIENILSFETKNLSEYLHNSISKIIEFLGITTQIVRTSAIFDKGNLIADDRILDICKKVNTDIYINPIGGQELYSKEKFKQNNIKLFFLQTGKVEYKQFGTNFIPSLSIIDVMMFNSPEEIKKMLNNYTLI